MRSPALPPATSGAKPKASDAAACSGTPKYSRKVRPSFFAIQLHSGDKKMIVAGMIEKTNPVMSWPCRPIASRNSGRMGRTSDVAMLDVSVISDDINTMTTFSFLLNPFSDIVPSTVIFSFTLSI